MILGAEWGFKNKTSEGKKKQEKATTWGITPLSAASH